MNVPGGGVICIRLNVKKKGLESTETLCHTFEHQGVAWSMRSCLWSVWLTIVGMLDRMEHWSDTDVHFEPEGSVGILRQHGGNSHKTAAVGGVASHKMAAAV